MVRGAPPGPAPAAQARASISRLTRSSWRTWPHRKLRSNCLFGQVVGLEPARFQGVAVLIMALQMVSSLRMHAVRATAVRATLGAFPAARSRWSKARIVGLYCVATKVAMYSTDRTRLDRTEGTSHLPRRRVCLQAPVRPGTHPRPQERSPHHPPHLRDDVDPSRGQPDPTEGHHGPQAH